MNIFFKGIMAAGKTAHLIDLLERVGKENSIVLSAMPDGTFNKFQVESRNGKKAICQLCEVITDLPIDMLKERKFLFIDEAQFLTLQAIKQIQSLSRTYQLQVYYFGLIKDFKGNKFEATKTLEMVTKSVEIPCICEECWGFTAQHNVIVKDNKIVEDGDIIQLDKNLYRSICNDCYCRLRGE